MIAVKVIFHGKNNGLWLKKTPLQKNSIFYCKTSSGGGGDEICFNIICKLADGTFLSGEWDIFSLLFYHFWGLIW